MENVEEIVGEVDTTRSPPKYEVVFFAKYKYNCRPTDQEIVNYFNHYGDVDHVKCPQDRNFAFIFMTTLNCETNQYRIKSTITRIINEMPEDFKFYVNVATSNRPPSQNQARQICCPHCRKYFDEPRNERSRTARVDYNSQRRSNERN